MSIPGGIIVSFAYTFVYILMLANFKINFLGFLVGLMCITAHDMYMKMLSNKMKDQLHGGQCKDFYGHPPSERCGD